MSEYGRWLDEHGEGEPEVGEKEYEAQQEFYEWLKEHPEEYFSTPENEGIEPAECKKQYVYIDGVSDKLVKEHSKNKDLLVVGVPMDNTYGSLVLFKHQVFEDKFHEGCKSLKLEDIKPYNVRCHNLVFNMTGNTIKECFDKSRETYKEQLKASSVDAAETADGDDYDMDIPF